MKILLALITTLFFLPGWTLCVAAPPAPNESQVERSIRDIRAHYKEINERVSKYRRAKKELSGFSTEGGSLAAYLDGDAIVKMIATFYGESGEATEEYYYWEGQLIFVFRTDSDYDHLLSGKVVHTAQDRFYFNNGVLIRWIDEHAKPVAPDEKTFQAKQNEYLQNSSQFEEAARSPRAIIESTH